MIAQTVLAQLANKWEIKWTPEYRRAICISCGRNVHKMWHIWLEEGGFKKEVHICKQCEKKLNI
jgi:RNase P subunit RPR2